MTFYVCKQCNYKHTFLPLACAKCKGTNFYPLITSEPTGNTSICNGMEIQEDVLKLRIENEQLKQENELAKSLLYCTVKSCDNCGNCNCENFQRQRKSVPCELYVSYQDRIKQLGTQIEKMKCCSNCDFKFRDGNCYYDKECKNKDHWKLKE